jgi:hypothetical protein
VNAARALAITALAGFAAVAVIGCADAYKGESMIVAPASTDFVFVSEALDYSCGSLDCHGTVGRNLRLYGTFGLRLDPKDVPCRQTTTDAEIAANYQSAAGLEPEVVANLVESNGAHPERLTLVRKARGTESHRGGPVFPEGSFGDLCLVSWLQGKVDEPSCNNLFSHLSNSLTVCKQATQP